MAVLNQGVWTQNDELAVTDSIATHTEPASGRYHLYISKACPWAALPWLVINCLRLDGAIGISSVEPKMTDGWAFSDDFSDPVNGFDHVRELYLATKADFSGRVTVPVLWDKQQKKIVGNSSAELAWDLADNWLALAKNPAKLVPSEKRAEITAMNEWLMSHVSRKVHQAGLFATGQADYERHVTELFDALGVLDKRLENQRYLFGNKMTLSDIFVFPTLARFEAVYAVHYKCNLKPLSAYANLYRYLIDLYALPAFKASIDMPHIKLFYYYSHTKLNPSRIVPVGVPDWL